MFSRAARKAPIVDIPDGDDHHNSDDTGYRASTTSDSSSDFSDSELYALSSSAPRPRPHKLTGAGSAGSWGRSSAGKKRSSTGTGKNRGPPKRPRRREPPQNNGSGQNQGQSQDQGQDQDQGQGGGQALRGVPDALTQNLICVFIGLNPGMMTSMVGHMYAHPRNHFWRLMHSGGLTPDQVCPPAMDERLPAVYSLGLTNIVDRPTPGQADLTRAEMEMGVGVCAGKLRRWEPESVCIVGKGIWEVIWRARTGRRLRKEEFVWGWQERRWEGARVYVVPSTSGLAAGISMEFKRECWRTLGDWVQMRRGDRGEVAPMPGPVGPVGPAGSAGPAGSVEPAGSEANREATPRAARVIEESSLYDESIFDEVEEGAGGEIKSEDEE